ncbi:MAG TPA: AAA family ATPase [Dehalococcoidia bacterium]|nr:AAA family ATPase [Dehalococcoidia bacterium]
MTLYKPSLFLKRLAVFHSGSAVYDQHFHNGVNIIRGSNGSGKSTITDFIFYVLGGDFHTWKPEAAICDSVIAEVEINGTTVTLKRDVSNSPRQPMHIFWGPFETANKSASDGWNAFPFQRTQNKESFSQALFRALEFPEVRVDDGSNITMHQILRLLYIDQMSPVETLMKVETFDQSLTRETIGALLFGAYDDSIYSDEISLREKQKEIEDVSYQWKNTVALLRETQQEIDKEALERQIEQTEMALSRVVSNLQEYSNKSDKALHDEDIKRELENIRNELYKHKQQLTTLHDRSNHELYEIEDSQQFIESLKKRLAAINDANITRKVLGELPLTHCPHCLAPLQESVSENLCLLCKQDISGDPAGSQAMRMRQELAHQIKESEVLLAEKSKKHHETALEIPIIKAKVEAAQTKYDETSQRVKTRRDSVIDSLLERKGSLQRELEYLHMQSKAIGILQELKSRKSLLTSQTAELESKIKMKRETQGSQLNTALAKIGEYALTLLRDDLPREDFFKNAINVSIDFSKNSFSVDGRNTFSASSVTYLKNCIRYAIMFTSLDFDFLRYPRIIICDNMEDKGMEQVRSQNFQKLIVAKSKAFETQHQIIFTTSMIDPSLNNTPLCVGPEYSVDHKALNLPAIKRRTS